MPTPQRPPPHRPSSAHAEWLLDEAIKESFPASDPPAPYLPHDKVTRVPRLRALARHETDKEKTAFWLLIGGCAVFAAGYLAGRRSR